MIVPADGFDGARALRHKYGVVVWPTESGTAIQAGDLLTSHNGDDAWPVGNEADSGTEAANQENSHDVFVGVALETVTFTERPSVLVATRGEFLCDMATAAAVEVGAAIGFSENSAGNALLNQFVEAVATRNLAFGHCSRRANPARRKVWVEICATVGPFPMAGPQTMV